MKKFEISLTIVDNKNSVAIIKKDGKVIRNLTLKNEDNEFITMLKRL